MYAYSFCSYRTLYGFFCSVIYSLYSLLYILTSHSLSISSVKVPAVDASQLVNVRRIRDFRVFSPKRDIYVNPNAKGSEIYVKRGQKYSKGQNCRWLQRNSVNRHRVDVHMNSVVMTTCPRPAEAQNTQQQQQQKPSNSSIQEGWWHKVLPLAEKLLTYDWPWEKESL